MVTSSTKTYDQDFALWVEENIALLKAKNYDAVDWDNLIEEVEGLTRSDKRELENRLITLFEHALKRRYVSLQDCYRGWKVTLKRTQKQLRRVLKDSPSLRNYFVSIIEECYQDALMNFPIAASCGVSLRYASHTSWFGFTQQHPFGSCFYRSQQAAGYVSHRIKINMRDEYDAIVPDHLPFTEDIDQLLIEEFWL